jgi:hypothetical protein
VKNFESQTQEQVKTPTLETHEGLATRKFNGCATRLVNDSDFTIFVTTLRLSWSAGAMT